MPATSWIKEANKPKGEKCEDCGRIVAEAALSEFDGKKICGVCREDRKEAARKERMTSPVKTERMSSWPGRRYCGCCLVLAVLAIIIIFGS